jgi:GLPGLI family protein
MGAMGKTDCWSEYIHSEFFKDFSTGILTNYCIMPPHIPNTQCVDSGCIQNWEIFDETLIIADYICQKATCSFRGRYYIAWFCPDIPINNGPWKFGGLPGLILKVYDDKQLCTYECTQVEFIPSKYPIKIHAENKTFKRINHNELLDLQKKINKNYWRMIGFVDGESEKLPQNNDYQPLELY